MSPELRQAVLAAERAAEGDSNDAEISALQYALDLALQELGGQPLTPLAEHLHKICKEAELGVMEDIFVVLRDREAFEDDFLLQLTAEDVTTFYDDFVGPAIDKIEGALEGRR